MFKSRAKKLKISPGSGAAQRRDDERVASQRRSVFSTMALSAPLTAAAWWGLYTYLPNIPHMTTEMSRLAFGLKCAGVASFLTLALPAEAISHERLTNKSINPLAAPEPQSKFMAVNTRVLQNNLEQVAMFAPAIVSLATFQKNGAEMRAVAASTVVYLASRGIYWAAYHVDPRYRALGLAGSMVHNYVLHIYLGAKFGYELAGPWGGAVVGALFAIGELLVSLPLMIDTFRNRKSRRKSAADRE